MSFSVCVAMVMSFEVNLRGVRAIEGRNDIVFEKCAVVCRGWQDFLNGFPVYHMIIM